MHSVVRRARRRRKSVTPVFRRRSNEATPGTRGQECSRRSWFQSLPGNSGSARFIPRGKTNSAMAVAGKRALTRARGHQGPAKWAASNAGVPPSRTPLPHRAGERDRERRADSRTQSARALTPLESDRRHLATGLSHRCLERNGHRESGHDGASVSVPRTAGMRSTGRTNLQSVVDPSQLRRPKSARTVAWARKVRPVRNSPPIVCRRVSTSMPGSRRRLPVLRQARPQSSQPGPACQHSRPWNRAGQSRPASVLREADHVGVRTCRGRSTPCR